ncbi:MAG: uracil-DNA glycosylase family protein [Caldimonas sp.]
MRWTERQRAMLREMGVTLWVPERAEPGLVEQAAAIATRASPPVAGAAPAPASASADAPSTGSTRAAARALDPAPDAAAAPTLAPADWLVVGAPFDGSDPRQEQLLDNMLRAIGVARAVRTRERRAAYLALDEAAPVDAAVLSAACELVAPRCIVALGRAAAAALLGSDAPIGNWRGRRHERGGCPVVVTFSLAFLLRHPADKAKAWTDLCLAFGAFDAA